MMVFFMILLGVPLLAATAAFVFTEGITWRKFACIAVMQLVIAGASAGICSCANTHDVEVWNGRVTQKYSEHVSCSHSYDCHCRNETTCSGSGKNKTCSTSRKCDTCYEHDYDVDWVVKDSIGQSWDIDRVDRRGLDEPPRFTAVKVGEPTSATHSYKNYVKASPDTLFRHQGLMEKYAATLPENPQKVYDYYRLNRLVTVGLNVDDRAAWDRDLSELNADLGSSKQANIILVLVKNQPQDWYYALEEKWIGGKKNDIVLVVSVDDEMQPQWATVMCWTTNELFKVQLRDDVMNDKVLTREAVMGHLHDDVSKLFVRKPMADFEYLSSSITPSTTAWVITLIISVLAAGGLIIFFEFNDVFDEEGLSFGTRPRRQRRRPRGTSIDDLMSF